MAKQLNDQRIWLASQLIASHTNQVALDLSAEESDTTNFGSAGWRERIGGLKIAALSASGFWDLAEPDATLFGQLGAGTPITVVNGATVGNTAYLMSALLAEYGANGQIGNPAAFSLRAANAGRLGRGQLVHNAAVIANGNSAAGPQLGALAAGQFLLASIHVTAVSGSAPTLTATVQSDDNAGFSSPTGRGTFAVLSAIGSGVIEIAGPVTDTYWRINFAVTGTSPSFTLAGALGISP